MNSPTRFRLVLVPALLALLAAHAPALADKQKATTNLVRLDPLFDGVLPPDTNARGSLTIETKTSSGRDILTLVVKKVAAGPTYNLFVEDPNAPGSFGPPIPLQKTTGAQKLKIDTGKGDTLPFGVESLADLAGVQVRVVTGTDPEDKTATFLTGRMPTYGLSTKPVQAKAKMSLAVNTPDTFCSGKVFLKTKASIGKDDFSVKIGMLDFNSFTFSLWIQDGPNSDNFVLAGIFTKKKSNSGFFRAITKDGDPLPQGQWSCSDFAGLVIQVRDQTDTGPVATHAYLSVLIPLLN